MWIQLIAALLGALGFAVRFGLPRRYVFVASVGGLLGWAVYLLFAHFGMRDFFSYLFGAAFAAAYADLFARILKVPNTIIYIPGVVPMIPGGSLYYTMQSAVRENWEAFRLYGNSTLAAALGIAVGGSIVMALVFIFKMFLHKRHA